MKTTLAFLLSLTMTSGTAMAAGTQMNMGDKQASESTFVKLDTDSDGKISKSEAQDNRTLANVYESVDVDNSGEISEAEFARFEATMVSQ